MRKNILMISLGMIFLLTIMINFVSSEFYMWNEVTNLEEQNVTDLHGLYKLDDTTEGFNWGNFEYDFTISYSTQDLPYNITTTSVDWCNLTIVHYANDYDNDGNYLNTTITENSLYFDSGLYSGEVDLVIKSADVVITDMKCHYTNSSSLYEDNILVGRYSAYFTSTQCSECSEFTLEELSNELDRADEITETELEIYEIVGTIIDLNYRLWLIASWIIKIFLLVVTFVLVFSGVYYLYQFMSDIARRI